MDEKRRLALGGDALVAEGGEDDEVVFEALGLVHGEDLDVGSGFLGGNVLGLHEGNELEGGGVGLAVEIRGDGNQGAEAALLERRLGEIELGGEVGGEAGIALFADESGPGGQVGGSERHLPGQGRHLDVAAGQGIAGMLDELGQREDGWEERVVEERGVAGPDGADALLRQGIEQGESLVVAARENGDRAPVEIGNALLEFCHEVGGAGNGSGAFCVFLGARQNVEGDVAGEWLVLVGGLVGHPFRGPAGGDFPPIGGQFLVGEGHVGQFSEDGVDGVENDGAGAPGFDQRRGHLDGGRFPGAVVLGEDAAEDARVAAAPLVDGLLGVADVEQRAVAVGILDDFVEEVFDDRPLDEGRVLEFIEEPMEEAGVEAAIDQGAETGRNRAGGGSEQLGDVVERQLSGAGDVAAMFAAVGGEEAIKSPRADDLPGEGRVADVGERG